MLKKIIQIDENGFFKRDVLIEEGHGIPSNCIETLCPDGFYLPKWDGEKWIEGNETTISLDLASLKTQKVSELDRLTNEDILNGFYSDCTGETKFYGMNYEDQQNMSGIMTLIANGIEKTIYWKEKGGFPTVYTKEQFMQLYSDAYDSKEQKWMRFHQLKAQVEQCQNADELDLIQW
jgi:hypothetical protein